MRIRRTREAIRGQETSAAQDLGRSLLLIVGLGIAATIGTLFLPPIPQDPAYHNFADQRSIMGVPNLLDVISNVPLIVVGWLGLSFVLRHRFSRPAGPFIEPWERWPVLVFFSAIVLTGFGSAYYHLDPNNTRLFWDRIPIALTFMSLLVTVIAERISVRAAQRLFVPLLAIGIGSVVYWHLGELRGEGDLRFYGLVQFLPIPSILLMLYLFPPRYTRTADLFGAVGLYALAKVLELLDTQIFGLGSLVSGHTLKHLAAALATYWILRMLKARRPVVALKVPDTFGEGTG